MKDYNCIVVLGPTASGKTRLACELAFHLDGEIINADSRQVYKGLNIGTGKDLHEYTIRGKEIPFHLINVADPSQQYYLHDFIRDLNITFNAISNKGRLPVICGGTGLYLDALHKDFSLTRVPEDEQLRKELQARSRDELLTLLNKYPAEQTAHVDRHSAKRIIRGIEVARYLADHPAVHTKQKTGYRPFYIGTLTDKEERARKIGERLRKRLKEGLIDEVRDLLQSGLPAARLDELGLEYRFVALHLSGKLSREEMTEKLETAIRQFAKRQMTWFRKMEREGIKIHWIKSPEEILPSLRELFT